MSVEIISQIEKDLGVSPDNFEFNNKFFRFGNKNEFWACGKMFTHTKTDYYIVNYGSWKTGQKFRFPQLDLDNHTSQFRTKFSATMRKIDEEIENAAIEKQKECTEKWVPKFFGTKITDKIHDYLKGKGIKSNHGARISRDVLLVPIENGKDLISVQRIYKDGDKFVKRFASGTKMEGSYSRINEFDITASEFIYVCEGFATGCTIFEVTGIDTVCSFTAGNLLNVIRFIYSVNPNVKIIIASDNDHETIVNGKPKNTGVDVSRYIKKLYPAIAVRTPSFSKVENACGLSDFNDLFQNAGEPETKEQLSYTELDFLDITLYGINSQKEFVYFSNQTNTIHSFSASAHTDLNLLSMAISSYWVQKFNGYDEDGKINWKSIVERIMDKQRKIGQFKDTDLRGRGSWIDNNKFIFNTGSGLIVDGVKFNYNSHSSKFRYIAGNEITVGNYLKSEESKKIFEALLKLRLKNKADAYYIAGWIALAQIPGFIEWRPHLWITGESGSGKTTVMKTISKLVYGQTILTDITAASLKQMLQHDSMPFLIDEAESNNRDSRRRMEQVMELIRQSSSRAGSKSARGTTHGKALEYSMNSIFCLSSIQPNLPTQADVTRFTQIELLQNKGQSKDEFKDIMESLEGVQHLGPMLLARMIKLAPVVCENAKIVSNFMGTLPKKDLRQRQCDQISWLIAGYLALKTERVINEFDLDELFCALDVGNSDYVEATEDNETQECLENIMHLKAHGMENIAHMLSVVRMKKDHDEYIRALASFGIKVGDNTFVIHTSNSLISRELARSESQFKNYATILARHPDFVKKKYLRIDGIVLKCIELKLPKLEDS